MSNPKDKNNSYSLSQIDYVRSVFLRGLSHILNMGTNSTVSGTVSPAPDSPPKEIAPVHKSASHYTGERWLISPVFCFLQIHFTY